MKKQLRLIFAVILSLLVTTGCWDSMELNDMALLLGWGMDLNSKGEYIGSAQIVIPSQAQSSSQSGGNSGSSAYFTELGKGKDVTDAALNLQTKLSRRITASHRKEIFIGEALAKHGLKEVMDEYTRNPDVRLRTDVFIVKGGTAQEILKIPQPLEKIPSIAALKLHEQVGGIGDIALANFLIDANTLGARATLPVMEIDPTTYEMQDQGQSSPSSAGTGYTYAGRAIFNKDLKLIGYLSNIESEKAFWVKGLLDFATITEYIPQGKGTVSLDLYKLKSRIQPSIQGNRIKFKVILTGVGIIRENNTSLDLAQTKNVSLVEDTINKSYAKRVKKVITKVQKKYKADILGFGETVHRQYPSQWKTLGQDWDDAFSNADVAVRVDLKAKYVGLTGQSLLEGTK